MAAVRFPDMQGKSLCMAVCSYFSLTSPEKGLPRLPPAGGTLSFAFTPKRRAVAGEGLAGGGLEGCASPEEANPSKVFSIGGNLLRRGLQGLLWLLLGKAGVEGVVLVGQGIPGCAVDGAGLRQSQEPVY